LSFIERRRARRFNFQLPIIVRWKHGSEMREVRTVSENLGINGIYFSLAEGIKNGTPVEVMVTLPNRVTLAGPLSVRCFGRVRRCEREEGAKQGIAAAFEKFEFLFSNEYTAQKLSSLI
jgi:hypothetical protein